MKKLLGLLIALSIVVPAYADPALVEVHNKFCPISHEEIGKDGMTPQKVTHNGKIYSLCCSMCKKDFMKDPDKYAKMLDEEAAADQKK